MALLENGWSWRLWTRFLTEWGKLCDWDWDSGIEGWFLWSSSHQESTNELPAINMASTDTYKADEFIRTIAQKISFLAPEKMVVVSSIHCDMNSLYALSSSIRSSAHQEHWLDFSIAEHNMNGPRYSSNLQLSYCIFSKITTHRSTKTKSGKIVTNVFPE